MPAYFTRRGDDGTTGVLGEGRLAKYDVRVEACGAVDEASAALGLARALAVSPEASAALLLVQRDLYRLMAELAATPENAERFRSIDAAQVTLLETEIERLGSKAEAPQGFILPGDSLAGAALALARTIVRRAERQVARLAAERGLANQLLLAYLNRLSSLCFVLELWENRAAGVAQATRAKGGQP
jgi:cob(I)alamin adenosyltransferase